MDKMVQKYEMQLQNWNVYIVFWYNSFCVHFQKTVHYINSEHYGLGRCSEVCYNRSTLMCKWINSILYVWDEETYRWWISFFLAYFPLMQVSCSESGIRTVMIFVL